MYRIEEHPAGTYTLYLGDTTRIGTIYLKSHAEQIVTACNVHEKLVDRLQYIKSEAEVDGDEDSVALSDKLLSVWRAADEALAAAGVKEIKP